MKMRVTTLDLVHELQNIVGIKKKYVGHSLKNEGYIYKVYATS